MRSHFYLLVLLIYLKYPFYGYKFYGLNDIWNSLSNNWLYWKLFILWKKLPNQTRYFDNDSTQYITRKIFHYLFQDEYKWIFHVVNFFYETINFRNHQLLSIVGWWLVFCVANCSQNVANCSLSCWPLNGPTLWPNSLSLIAKLNLIW